MHAHQTAVHVAPVLCLTSMPETGTMHATGLVRGSPAAAVMQWAGRSNCLFAVLHCIPEVRAQQ